MAVVVRFGAVPEDGCVGCGKPEVPAGRACFLVAVEGPPLLGLQASSGSRPFEDDEGASTRGRLAQARAWALAASRLIRLNKPGRGSIYPVGGGGASNRGHLGG